jgi:dTDP-4-dehydrorhamnose 3,5-epimerase
MIFTETKLKKAYIIEIKRIEDERGFFGRSWCRKELEDHGLNADLQQANTSFSKKKGTLRGMHFQVHPHEEAKLIRCVRGAIYDVIIDLRPDSPTFKQWTGVELTQDNYKMVYIPEGFAHGYLTLTDDTEVYYNVTAFYAPGAEKGIRWNDSSFQIRWPITPLIISEKDASHPDFKPESIYPENQPDSFNIA